MPILYDYPRAPSPRRARIVLAEKGIAHETVLIDLASGEQMGAAFRAINPLCTVPALALDDGCVLTDNAGIAAWAEAAYPDPPLFGRTPVEKAEIASWNARMEMEVLLAIAEALRNSAPAMKDRALPGPANYPQIPALAERGLARLHAAVDMTDRRLAQSEYLAGAAFSLADITAAVALDFARVIGVKPVETHDHIRRWSAQLAERPAFSL